MKKHLPTLATLALCATTSCAQTDVVKPAQPAQRLAQATPPVAQPAPVSAAKVTMRPVPLDIGGWVSGFSIHSSGRLYSYGDVFGLWRSDDAGQSWKYLLNDFTTYDHFGTGVAVSDVDPDTVLYTSPKNLYKSTDGGATWKILRNRITVSLNRGSNAIVFQPGSTKEMWLASQRNRETGWFWHTTDGGETWEKVAGDFFNNIAVTTTYIHPKFPDQIWVGATGGLFVSTDHGKTFTNVWDNNGGGRSPMGYRPQVTSIARRSDGTGYFASNIGGYHVTATDWNDPKTFKATLTVSRSNGNGPVSATVLADDSFVTMHNGEFAKQSKDGSPGSWVELPMNLDPKYTPVYLTPKPDGKVGGGRDMLVQDPTKHSRWFMTGGKALVITEDNGATWNYPPNGSGMAGLVAYGKIDWPRAKPNQAMINAADQGIFVLNDGGKSGKADYSSRRTVEKHMIFFNTMSSDDGQTLVAAGCAQAENKNMIIRSTNGGKDWTELDLTNSGLPVSEEGIIRSAAAPGNTQDYVVLTGFASWRKNNNPGVYRTQDGGATFTKATGIPDGVDTGHRYGADASSLEADGVKTNTRYLSLRSQNKEDARGFYRSDDGGSTWAKTAGQPFGKEWITDMSVDRTVAGQVWATGKGVSRSDDGGETWAPVGAFKQASRVSASKGCIAVWGRLAGDEWNKLYYSADSGANWVEVTGPGRRLPFLHNVTINPHKTNELWISNISASILTVVMPGVRTANR
ncbi:MAG TPA: hypothetical protein VF681_12205 [Abditibacteriaceae bacterium]|jgi:photosystem II stability/assembly factor-like uncharacterized protein